LKERAFVKEMVHQYQLMDKYFFSKEKPKRRLSIEEKYIGHVILTVLQHIFTFILL